MKATQKQKRKIVVPLVDRANYGRLKPVMRAIASHPDLQLQVICTGTMVLERFGLPQQQVLKDGFPVDGSVYIEIEGSVPGTMAKSLGLGVIEFANEFHRLQPDILLVIGDRYEMLATVIAASMMNICIAHIQGGEVSGSIDESTRHVITKFAHYHFPATRRAADFIVKMGEDPNTVFHVGCPSSDIALSNTITLTNEMINSTGSGCPIDVGQPFILVIFHPITTQFGQDEAMPVQHILQALHQLQMQTIWLWPNIDAGADHISKLIRCFREQNKPNWLHLAKNFSPEIYARILAQAAVAVGNSSSFVRDSGFYGTPVVLVGDRQDGREFAENVTCVKPQVKEILTMIRHKLAHGRYPPSTLYGDGCVSPRIAQHLARVPIYIQKRLNYIYRQEQEFVKPQLLKVQS